MSNGLHRMACGSSTGRAGELAEDEGPAPLAGLLDRDVLLADQVHAVDQRRDEQRVRHRVVRGELPLRQAPVQVVHGHVVAGLGEPPVDPPDVLFDGRAELAVLPHVVPARHGDLQEGGAGTVFGVALQQHLHRQQTLHNALGVVEPVDPEQQRAPGELLRQRARCRHPSPARWRAGELARVDRDGRGRGLHYPSVGQHDRGPAHLDARAASSRAHARTKLPR